MFANLPTWTTERVDQLKAHFAAGLSCREIAGEIGVSRNAVIGKLSRLGLTRDKPSAEPRTKQPPRERRTRSVPRQQYEMLRAVYDEGQNIDVAVVSERQCSLYELSKEHCRWPVSAADAQAFAFCGNTPIGGLPYCAGHTRLAYRSSARRAS